jgi:hypothetical protein
VTRKINRKRVCYQTSCFYDEEVSRKKIIYPISMAVSEREREREEEPSSSTSCNFFMTS